MTLLVGCVAPPSAAEVARPAAEAPARVVVVGGAPTRAQPLEPAAAPTRTAPNPAASALSTPRAGDMAVRSLATNATPAARITRTAGGAPSSIGTVSPGASKTTARRGAYSAVGTPSAKLTPPGDAAYPTPTRRPAHPPARGSFIIPHPSQPLTRDHTADTSGFYRSDSITPVPFHPRFLPTPVGG